MEKLSSYPGKLRWGISASAEAGVYQDPPSGPGRGRDKRLHDQPQLAKSELGPDPFYLKWSPLVTPTLPLPLTFVGVGKR